MATILVVEDDKHTQLLTVARLENFFHVISCSNGEEALELIYEMNIDLIVSDVMMPEMDGYDLLKRIREERLSTPVLLLTAKQEIEDKRIGFTLGSDDYLTKPVNYDELIWRIQALLRRAKISTENEISFGKTKIDSKTLSISYLDNQVELSKKEFDLVFKFLSYPNIVFTKNQLLDDIWGYDSESSEDTIKTHISKLRNKLKDFDEFKIITIKGIGYKGEIREGLNDGK